MAKGSITIDDLLAVLWDARGSDLLVAAGSIPRIRVAGRLQTVDGIGKLSPGVTESMVKSLLNDEQWAEFAIDDVDFSLTWRDVARIRGNAFRQRGSVSLALRMMPCDVPGFDQLGLPPAVRALAQMEQGLVLVTGPTGSGKSTTLASLIDWINRNRPVHILTIEDPIEYEHLDQQALVSQRAIGDDAPTFATALRSALREDPDVLLVGELRDLESIGFALTMAKTGHLVFATLHANDTSQTVDRLLDAFPVDQQPQVRAQIASLLTAVVYQRLLPRIGGGQVAAFEVLISNIAIRNLINEAKTNQVRSLLQSGIHDGMQTFEMSLNTLVSAGLVTHDDAVAHTEYPQDIVADPGS
ncbi:MAG: PilT/PilU family type 4a pilus ATPase [Actinomycetes bacterium]